MRPVRSGLWRGWRAVTLAAGAGLLLAACSGGSSSGSAAGRTVTFAEAAGGAPNYILPLASGSYFTTSNLAQFSLEMYLPLYWFGNHGEPTVNYALSVADPPVFSDHNTVVTINLKHWNWSNGQPITARDVVFWMNLLSAVTDPLAPTVGSSTEPGPGWGAEVPGGFPQNLVSYRQIGQYSLSLHLNGSYNPTWFTYNELSQISPLPQASWDRLHSGGAVGDYDASAETREPAPASAGLPAGSYLPVDPGTATTGALAVAQYLNQQSQDLGTYSTNPMWQVVDGPFRLTQFTTGGFVKMVPNRGYSGSPKPKIAAFEELPFTSDSSEFNALHTQSLTIGYIPVQDLGQAQSLERTGGYKMSPWYLFSFNFARYNFTNPTVGPIFAQLYFRQAFQSLVNQRQYIKDFGHGVGAVTNGPVPSYPPGNPDESTLEAKGEVYPYSPSRAVNLLSSHGWTVRPGGESFCSRAGTASGDCGAGIAKGQTLTFDFLYASGITELSNEMQALQSTVKSVAGITLNLSSVPFSDVVSTIHNSCSFTHPCSNWQLAATGGGWVYGPDYFPTGGEIFAPGAGSNAGYYSSATNDSNITLTHTAPTPGAETRALYTYEDYLATQLPDVWFPTNPTQLTVYRANLRGLVPQGVFAEIYPQDYSFAG